MATQILDIGCVNILPSVAIARQILDIGVPSRGPTFARVAKSHEKSRTNHETSWTVTWLMRCYTRDESRKVTNSHEKSRNVTKSHGQSLCCYDGEVTKSHDKSRKTTKRHERSLRPQVVCRGLLGPRMLDIGCCALRFWTLVALPSDP